MRLLNSAGDLLARGDGAEHRIGMADDVFGGSLDRDIHAMSKRLEVERRSPGIVENDHGAGVVRSFHDCRDVLYLEGLRSGRLGEDELRLRREKLFDPGSDQG